MCSLFIPPFSSGPVTRYEHNDQATGHGREASLSPALPAGGVTAQRLTSLHCAFATARGSPPQTPPVAQRLFWSKVPEGSAKAGAACRPLGPLKAGAAAPVCKVPARDLTAGNSLIIRLKTPDQESAETTPRKPRNVPVRLRDEH